jgi:DeoR/GlpR family transcriptional regulator of sugar metabolism
MRPATLHDRIVATLKLGTFRPDELARMLDAEEMTIRRYLRDLADEGSVERKGPWSGWTLSQWAMRRAA